MVGTTFQVWIYGNSFESFLVAVANPNKEALESWAAANGISGDFESLCQNPKAKEYILGELSRIGKEKKVRIWSFSCFSVSSNSCLLDPGTHALTLLVPQLKGFEFIKDVHLEPVPFDMDRDLITPTYKKKRPQLLQYYQVLLIEILLENLQFIFFICTIAPV